MPVRRWRGHRAVFLAAALLIAAATAFAAHLHPNQSSRAAAWSEIAWSMPLDNWGQGRAWRATTADGSQVRLFARTKTGFCNCFNGIADDAEIDRIGDVDLHGDDFQPVGPGEVTTIGDLAGRKRAFTATGRWNGSRHVLSLVASSDCKAVVATLVSKTAIAPATEASAVALLTNGSFRQWADDQ